MTNHATILNTPASYGAEYVDDGDRYQLTSARGLATVHLSFNPGDGWRHWGPITRPDRFGPVPIKDAKAWRAWVAAWLAPEDSDRS